MIIQIYEIQEPEEAERCIELGVNRIGSVLLSADDWKQEAVKEVIGLSKSSAAKNSIIPLFSDNEDIYRVLDYYQPDYIHFCDNLTDSSGSRSDLNKVVAMQKELKDRFPDTKIMRSIPIPVKGAVPGFPFLDIARKLEPLSDEFLIDTWFGNGSGNEPVEGFIGITGEPADWERSLELVTQSKIPVILAGGLSPENVYDALMQVIPQGADSCTQTNETDEAGKPVRFKKDLEKVGTFVNEVIRAVNDLTEKKDTLLKKLAKLKLDLEDREAALPAHTVRPNQIMVIEELEEKIDETEKKLERLR